MKLSFWDVIVIRYDCGCESHYRKRKDEDDFYFYDCSVKCSSSRPQDNCEYNYAAEAALIKSASEEMSEL